MQHYRRDTTLRYEALDLIESSMSAYLERIKTRLKINKNELQAIIKGKIEEGEAVSAEYLQQTVKEMITHRAAYIKKQSSQTIESILSGDAIRSGAERRSIISRVRDAYESFPPDELKDIIHDELSACKTKRKAKLQSVIEALITDHEKLTQKEWQQIINKVLMDRTKLDQEDLQQVISEVVTREMVTRDELKTIIKGMQNDRTRFIKSLNDHRQFFHKEKGFLLAPLGILLSITFLNIVFNKISEELLKELLNVIHETIKALKYYKITRWGLRGAACIVLLSSGITFYFMHKITYQFYREDSKLKSVLALFNKTVEHISLFAARHPAIVDISELYQSSLLEMYFLGIDDGVRMKFGYGTLAVIGSSIKKIQETLLKESELSLEPEAVSEVLTVYHQKIIDSWKANERFIVELTGDLTWALDPEVLYLRRLRAHGTLEVLKARWKEHQSVCNLYNELVDLAAHVHHIPGLPKIEPLKGLDDESQAVEAPVFETPRLR